MSLSRIVRPCAVAAIVASCTSTHAQTLLAPAAAEPAVPVPAAAAEPLLSAEDGAKAIAPFHDDAELSLPRLVEQVESRNPTLQAMTSAWQAATERFPQAVALEDPMFLAMMAPASFDSPVLEPGYTLEASQKIPWFGKRAARGRQARAEANAAYYDVADSRVRLVEVTRAAFFDYYLVFRQLDLNRQNVENMRQFRNAAQAKYQANQVTQQDVLQADLELADLDRRQIELERLQKVSVARINTLLREPPFAPLPPAPQQLDAPSDRFDVEALQQLALTQRPDLAALAARIRAEQAAVAVACKDYYPDVAVFGRYDAMWQEKPLQPAVGVNLNVPIYRGRLNAAVREAMFRVGQRRAEYEQLVLDVQYETAAAYSQLEEARRALQLYAQTLVPVAEQNVASTRANYDVNKASFLDLAIAQRQLIGIREKREEALAEYHRRLAELERVVGGSVLPATADQQAPAAEFP